MSLRRTMVAYVLITGALVAGASSSAARAADADVCAAMSSPTYERLNPASGAQLLTGWESEADGAAARYGFTDDRQSTVKVSTTSEAGLTAVHRLYRPASRDLLYTTSPTEIAYAVRAWGYRDHGPVFYASATPGGCAVPVLRFQRGALHRLVTEEGREALQADGWRYEIVAFFATPSVPTTPAPPATTTLAPPPPPPTTTTTAPTTTTLPATTTTTLPATTTTAPAPPTSPGSDDSTFSFAVIPDTQNETYASEQRMQRRVAWLLDQRDELDLEWVLHSGDVHNWDTPDHSQFAAMSSWLQPLIAEIPFVAAIGNHDTGAVCPGGSACPGADASVTVRDTTTWNAYYSPARFGFEGVFEADKSDNGWRTIEAGGEQWMLLSLELWPRTEVIQWARTVIAAHPDHNVVVVTHSFLEGNGQLSTSNGGYGANSPATLWAALDDYPNVQMIFSGHVGDAATTTLTAADGHPVVAFLQAFHDPSRNPTRIVTVDTASGSVSTSIVANWDKSTGSAALYEYTAYADSISGFRFVS